MLPASSPACSVDVPICDGVAINRDDGVFFNNWVEFRAQGCDCLERLD